jgi:SAM-dependent methyltransferase
MDGQPQSTDEQGPAGQRQPPTRDERARSFGRIAEAYDRWRPDYPDALYASVLDGLEHPLVLEAGAGTGRATLGLAQRGARMLSIEPDAEMAAVARRRSAGLDVELRVSAFEDFQPERGAFDRVVSAQAWHWVDPKRGPLVAARALRDGGELCVWWNRPRALEGPVWEAIHDAYATHAPELDRRDRLRSQSRLEADAAAAPGFEPWRIEHFDWVAVYDAESYAALLATHSDHVLLDAARRESLLAGVRAAIESAGGGRLEYRYRTLLLRAARLS